MASKPSSAAKKRLYDLKLCKLLDEHSQLLVVAGSNHLQNIRKGVRGEPAVVLMGKNTLMKRSLLLHAQMSCRNKAFLGLVPALVGNVGLIFPKQNNIDEVTEKVVKYKQNAEQPKHFQRFQLEPSCLNPATELVEELISHTERLGLYFV